MFGKKHKLRILIVSQYFWPENFRINDLAIYFSKKGHNVTVLTGWPNYPSGAIYKDFKKNKKKFNYLQNIEILRVPIISRGNTKLFLVANYISFFLSSIFLSLYKLKNRKFDLVFTSQYSPVFIGLTSIFICKLKKIKHVIWVQDLWPETLLDLKILKKKGIPYLILKKIVNYIFCNSDYIFAQSVEFIKIIRKNYKLKNILYLPNWAEDIFLKSQKKKIKNLKNNKLNLVFTGNIGQAQDFNSIINAAKLLKGEKNIYWRIYGDGRMYNEVKDNVKRYRLNKNFIFYGKKPLNQMPKILNSSDALIITMVKSKFLNKTIPGKFQAYLTAKKPIIGMIDGVTNNIIKMNNIGVTSKSGDFRGFVKNIYKIYKSSLSKRNYYGQNAYQFYLKNYEKKNNLDLLEQKIYQIIKQL